MLRLVAKLHEQRAEMMGTGHVNVPNPEAYAQWRRQMERTGYVATKLAMCVSALLSEAGPKGDNQCRRQGRPHADVISRQWLYDRRPYGSVSCRTSAGGQPFRTARGKQGRPYAASFHFREPFHTTAGFFT
jgi:hypothetical protein